MVLLCLTFVRELPLMHCVVLETSHDGFTTGDVHAKERSTIRNTPKETFGSLSGRFMAPMENGKDQDGGKSLQRCFD